MSSFTNEASAQDQPEHASSESSRLRRHYSSIGIGDVFLESPPPQTLPQSYLRAPVEGGFETTWEIVGSIKSVPEDFVVREISARNVPGLSPQTESSLYVADLVRENPSSHEGLDTAVSTKHSSASRDGLVTADDGDSSIAREVSVSNPTAGCASEEAELMPMDVVTKILNSSFGEEGGEILTSIQALQQEALSRIDNLKCSPQSKVADSTGSVGEDVWVPPLRQQTSDLPHGVQDSKRGGDRGAFHRALKVTFPLLCSETVKHHQLHPNDNELPKEDGPWIRVSIDDSFFGLVPMLYQPELDLPALYLFRNRGCVLPSTNEEGVRASESAIRGRGKKGRQRRSDRGIGRDPTSKCAAHVPGCGDNNESDVVLRLRQNLTRDERRPVHHLIAACCRDFETSTIPNFPIQSNEETDDDSACPESKSPLRPSPATTAAVVVKWSKQARRVALRKRKRPERNTVTSASPGAQASGSNNPHTLCVMRKKQKEHLTAIQHLSTGLRCRQSDIGLAGIKDMQAVTYQFVTIRASRIQRVRQANPYLLRHGMELGTFHAVNWTLNHGDLEGNRFEIVVRDLARLTVRPDAQSRRVEERRVPCEISHVKNMMDRIQRSGFINFYGEQRVGIPGDRSEVGVRAFDIGRAMLQQDFATAIDLIMTGRLICRGLDFTESPEIRHARKVWKESGGDAVATLKALPRGEVMARERTVLQGLKRYGKDAPLAAIKCLHYGVRTFWINAYQSYVWNLVASERIKRLGVKVVPGDLYVEKRGNLKEVQVAGYGNMASIELSQVVLPLPGYKISYPENEIGGLYEEILKRDSVRFEQKAPHEATAKGSYRPLLAFAKNLKVDFGGRHDDNSRGSLHVSESQHTTDKAAKVMKMTFDLSSGSYATSMLRELMVTTVTRDCRR